MSAVERDNAGTVATLPVSEQQNSMSEAEAIAGRDYVVLKRDMLRSPGSPQVWQEVAKIKATSPEQAVRRAAEAPGTSFLNTDGSTTLVAVPVRSFNPMTIEVKVETTIVVS